MLHALFKLYNSDKTLHANLLKVSYEHSFRYIRTPIFAKITAISFRMLDNFFPIISFNIHFDFYNFGNKT